MTLRVYQEALVMISEVRPYRLRIAKEDPNHADQLRRASKAVATNCAEASGSRGRNQQAKFHIALGEARETLAHLEIAVADGIIDGIDTVLASRLSFIIGSLVKLSRASRQ
jgi:four helix bundle protein